MRAVTQLIMVPAILSHNGPTIEPVVRWACLSVASSGGKIMTLIRYCWVMLGCTTYGCYDGLAPSADEDVADTADSGDSGGGATSGGPEPSSSDACEDPWLEASPQRLRLLNAAQLSRTLASVTHGRAEHGVIPDAVVGSVMEVVGAALPNDPEKGALVFSAPYGQHRIGTSNVNEYLSFAETAASLLQNEDPFVGCISLASDDYAACMRTAMDDTLPRFFRRPVGQQEVSDLVAHAVELEAEYGSEQATANTLKALILAPSFLYRSELGDAQGALTPHEIASALSYSLLDSPPDEILWAKAQDGSLADPEVIAGEVERLLADPGASGPLQRMFFELFDFGRVAEFSKLEDFHDEQALQQEAELFVQSVLASSGRAGLQDALFTSTRAFASKQTYVNYDA